jgi:hypothetical protein
VNNVTILSLPSDKGSIDGYGAPDKFLEQVNYLFGKQTFTGGFTAHFIFPTPQLGSRLSLQQVSSKSCSSGLFVGRQTFSEGCGTTHPRVSIVMSSLRTHLNHHNNCLVSFT